MSWQVYLLAEIIKTSLPSHVLFGIIRDSNIQPKWNDIALPYGTCTPVPPRRCRRHPPIGAVLDARSSVWMHCNLRMWARTDVTDGIA